MILFDKLIYKSLSSYIINNYKNGSHEQIAKGRVKHEKENCCRHD